MESPNELQGLHDFLFGETGSSSLFVTLTKPMLPQTNYPNMKCLDLEGQAIRFFNDRVFDDLLDLESINLHDNLISNLPDNLFANNRKLRTIILQENLIEELRPQVFRMLTALRILDLSSNSIIKLEKSCLDSPLLYCLNLSYNQISDINCEAFRCLPELRDLDLSFNCLDTVNISAPKLYTLNLGMNDVQFLTFDVPKLTCLQLNRNCIGSFEEIVVNCPRTLRVLNLEANMIDVIAGTGAKKFSMLESLRLTVNSKIQFEWFVYLSQLRKLHITYLGPFNFNQRQVQFGLHKKGFLKHLKLTFANFEYTWFQMLPKINNVRFYSLSCSIPNYHKRIEIDIYDDILTKLPKLNSLTLENLNDFYLKERRPPVINSLKILALRGLRNPKLNDLFRHFRLLVELEIVESSMKTLSRLDFNNLFLLKSLNCSYSKLERIESECFDWNTRLVTINLSYCSINFIANNCFVRLKKLKDLNLTNNPIRNVSSQVFSGLNLNGNIVKHDSELEIIHEV